MSGEDDSNAGKNGGDNDASSHHSSLSPDDSRVTPLGGNAGVHIRTDDEEAAPIDNDVEIDFGGFIVGLGTSCMINLGQHENPETGGVQRDLPAALEIIHILEMLEEKTNGNLSLDEERLLKTLLLDLRKAYQKASA